MQYQDGKPTVWTIRKVRLYEVSVVTFPAYTDTSVEVRRTEFADLKKRRSEAWKAKTLARLRGVHADA